MMFPSWIRCPNSDCSWFTSLPLFLPSSTCTHNNIGKWLISIYICMSIYVYHMGPCSVFQLILNLIVFIFLFSPLGCTIKCMKCKNGPTHVLLFFGGKIQRNVERVLVVGHAFICGMKLNSALHSVLFEIR